jgi:Skp family chaperone for outer membrane proteins
MKKRSVVFFSLLLLGAVAAQGADTRIAYVDLQKSLNLTAEGKADKEKITGNVQEDQGVIDKRNQERKKIK